MESNSIVLPSMKHNKDNNRWLTDGMVSHLEYEHKDATYVALVSKLYSPLALQQVPVSEVNWACPPPHILFSMLPYDYTFINIEMIFQNLKGHGRKFLMYFSNVTN